MKRHAIFLPVEVNGKKDVKGLINDLSLGGCRINGNLAVRPGQHLPLRLHLPGQESPIVVERAAVRWVGEKDFGLQFMSIPSRERERLGDCFSGWHKSRVSNVWMPSVVIAHFSRNSRCRMTAAFWRGLRPVPAPRKKEPPPPKRDQ